MKLKQFQERISAIFYQHGLFCSSHPFALILFVIAFSAFICYPLLNLPLPGNAPLQFTTPNKGYEVPPISPPKSTAPDQEEPKRPRWYIGPPVTYIQQIIVKAVVSPWQPLKLIPTDAFRTPLAKAFDVVEHVNNFQFNQGKEATSSLYDQCLHVYETLGVKQVKRLVPEYNCLVISPANFWQNDKSRFDGDGEIIQTIFQTFGPALDSPPSIRDVLFGVPWKDSGVKRYYIRNRQRVISFSVTVALEHYNPNFLSALREKLHQVYPDSLPSNNSRTDNLTHVYFKNVNYFAEYIPLFFTYVVLFLYIYFSVRKIEYVKSKWGLALAAVMTVIASLMISIAVCLSFGLAPSLNGSEIFPYLVVIIGLENVLVVTKSVVSTPVHLDVKLRVAEGLSKEGWFIFKNLMAELLLCVIGFFTFVPEIQEFALFAVVGLLSDFFLQMFFFTTVLSIDIRRMELSDLHKQNVKYVTQEGSDDPCHPRTSSQCPVLTHMTAQDFSVESRSRSSSSPVLSKPPSLEHLPTPPPSPTLRHASSTDDVFMPDTSSHSTPKRVKLLNFWAGTRVLQRAIMVCVVIWILLIVHKTGIVEHFTQTDANVTEDYITITGQPTPDKISGNVVQTLMEKAHVNAEQTRTSPDSGGKDEQKKTQMLVYHDDQEQWRKLSHSHWPTLFGYYNISLQGRYITILPSMHLSFVISPDDAIGMRHTKEEDLAARYSRQPYYFHLDQSIAMKYDPSLTFGPNKSLSLVKVMKRLVGYPRTKLEFIVTVMLGLASFILFTYFIVQLYKCMCTRNYAKWRSSWHRSKRDKKGCQYCKQIMESVPLVLQGHQQEVECAVTDGPLIVSSCLGGQIRVWDSTSGECITAIERRSVTPPMLRKPIPGRNVDDSDADLYAEFHQEAPPGTSPTNKMTHYGSPHYCSDQSRPSADASTRRHSTPRRKSQPDDVSFDDIAPDLSGTIDTDFAFLAENKDVCKNAKKCDTESDEKQAARRVSEGYSPQAYDFSGFDVYYREHNQHVEEKKRYIEQRKAVKEHKDQEHIVDSSHQRSWSFGESPTASYGDNTLSDSSIEWQDKESSSPAIWCIVCQNSLIVAGCGNGQIEFWDGLSGQLKCMYSRSKIGVTALCFVAKRVVAARLNGTLDFLELETFESMNKPPSRLPSTPSVQKRGPAGHQRNRSMGSCDMKSWDDVIHCTHISSPRAHQRPITLLQTQGGRVVTGSQDHTLKVFRLEDSLPLYTLHGHNSSVTVLFLDKVPPLGAASGSDDGTVRLWDLMTGSCVHKLQGHSAAVTSLECTQTLVISSGIDDRLCVWDRSKGNLLHWIQMDPGFCNSLSLLTSNLMVTGGQGCLYLWDVSKGQVLRAIQLGDCDHSVFVRQIQVKRDWLRLLYLLESLSSVPTVPVAHNPLHSMFRLSL